MAIDELACKRHPTVTCFCWLQARCLIFLFLPCLIAASPHNFDSGTRMHLVIANLRGLLEGEWLFDEKSITFTIPHALQGYLGQCLDQPTHPIDNIGHKLICHRAKP